MLVVSTTSLQDAVVCLKEQMMTYTWFVTSEEILQWSGYILNYFEIFDLSHRRKTTSVWILYMKWRHRNNFHFPPHLSTHKFLLLLEERQTNFLFFCASSPSCFPCMTADVLGRQQPWGAETVTVCVQDAKAFLQLFSLGFVFNPGMCTGLFGSRETSHGDREHRWIVSGDWILPLPPRAQSAEQSQRRQPTIWQSKRWVGFLGLCCAEPGAGLQWSLCVPSNSGYSMILGATWASAALFAWDPKSKRFLSPTLHHWNWSSLNCTNKGALLCFPPLCANSPC